MRPADGSLSYRTLDQLRVADLEAIRLVLEGGSVIDWRRLNFRKPEEARELIHANEFRLDEPADATRLDAIKTEAIGFLRRTFDFPVPKPVAELDIVGLLMLASHKGHRQLCACTILKVMHIIHHLEAHELLSMLPISNQEVFSLVEQKVYRVVGGMLARGFPILEFIGGRKNKDSLYTKLLSKDDTTAANIYDKLRFRIVTRARDEIFPVLNHLLRHVFPFNYVIPNQSTNTIFHFRSYCEEHRHLASLLPELEPRRSSKDEFTRRENRFSAPDYRIEHFVVDMPLRLPPEELIQAPPAARALGRVIFAQAEFQITDRQTEQENELGEASHAAYKARQKDAVARRLKLGGELAKRRSARKTR